MGGLKKDLPVTYWTFLIGAIAIAGVPGLAGFFSKDEILWRTFAAGHWILWTIGIVTSLLTATYMFRLVFLTFHGSAARPRAPAHPEEEPQPSLRMRLRRTRRPEGTTRAATDTSTMRRRRWRSCSSCWRSVSVVAGYVGVPAAIGGNNYIEHYLHPSFVAHGTSEHRERGGWRHAPGRQGTGEHAPAPEPEARSPRACGTGTTMSRSSAR